MFRKKFKIKIKMWDSTFPSKNQKGMVMHELLFLRKIEIFPCFVIHTINFDNFKTYDRKWGDRNMIELNGCFKFMPEIPSFENPDIWFYKIMRKFSLRKDISKIYVKLNTDTSHHFYQFKILKTNGVAYSACRDDFKIVYIRIHDIAKLHIYLIKIQRKFKERYYSIDGNGFKFAMQNFSKNNSLLNL